jgi:hypothetical protein
VDRARVLAPLNERNYCFLRPSILRLELPQASHVPRHPAALGSGPAAARRGPPAVCYPNVLVAREHDRRRTAIGLLAVARLLVDDDVNGRIALAQLMCSAAAELLSGVPLEQFDPDAVIDMRRWWN